MAEPVSSVLGPWSNFYALTGTSASALTGLMFVVITLVTGEERAPRSPDGISTFSTPTVLHFCAALLVSAILIAPWGSLLFPATLVALTGLYGVVYVLRVSSRARHLETYRPDFEDLCWYTILPLIAHFAMLAGAAMLFAAPAGAPYPIAGGVAFLILIGIRNAWDVVTFLAMDGLNQPRGPVDRSP